MVQSTAQEGPTAQTDDGQPGLRYKRNPRRDFVQVSWKVTRCPHLTDGAKVLYTNIVSHDWGENPCFPGIDKLASYQGVSRQQASAYLNELKAANLVRSRRRFGTTSVYEIESDEDSWRLDVNQRLRPVRDTVVNPGLQQSSSTVDDNGKAQFTTIVNPGLHKEYAVPNTQSSNTQSSKKRGASAPRARKASTPKPELDDDTKTAARTFLDAFCQMWPTPRQADPGWWSEAVNAVQAYPLGDLLALVAYKKSRGRISDAIRPKHVAADMEGWVAVGRPTAAARQNTARGTASTLTATAAEMRESMHGIAFCPECDRVLPNHTRACSQAAKGGAA